MRIRSIRSNSIDLPLWQSFRGRAPSNPLEGLIHFISAFITGSDIRLSGLCLDKLNASVSIGFPFLQAWRACVIKLDIVNAVVTRTNVTRTKAEQAVETVFETIKSALGRGRRIELRRFGVFNVKPRKTGIGRNPRTGQEVNIPPGKAVRFKPGKELQSI